MVDNTLLSKRQLILRAAAEIFSSKGYHSAKIEDIAQQAGVGKGTVYEYFQSKDQLFRDTLKEGANAIAQIIQEHIDRETTTRGKLIAFTRKNIEMGRRYRVLSKITMMVTSIMDDSFHDWLMEMHKAWLAAIEKIIREGVETGQIKPIDINCFAHVFSGGIGIIASPLVEVDINPENEEHMAAEIVDYFLDGVSCHIIR